MASRGQTRIAFVVPYLIFTFFVIFVASNMLTSSNQYNPSLLNATNYTSGVPATQSNVIRGNVRPPTCSTGWFIIDGIIGCGVNYILFFIGMAFVSTDFLIINVIIFLPLGIAFIWAVLEVIRG